MKVVLISTYDLGRQPFGLASPAAWLSRQGHQVCCLDLAVERLDRSAVSQADLVGFHVPMHTATRIAAPLIGRVRQINPSAHICIYGLYAPLNEAYLRQLGADSILGGEFEEGLTALANQLPANGKLAPPNLDLPAISLSRQQFILPQRGELPPLQKYAFVQEGSERRTAGYTEATRGCKHVCRHCPIVPVYNGQFRVVQSEVVLADIRAQVNAGAQHITFGDPDFFNGPGHAKAIVEALHQEFHGLTYDVTIKVEHLLKHDRYLPILKRTGCLFITSAVESNDNRVLQILDKGHTAEDFVRAVNLCREHKLVLNPTFVTFSPWTTLESYRHLLQIIAELNLVDQVAPIQYAIRLLIPAGSRLLELSEVQELVQDFDQLRLAYPWSHPDPRVDRLFEEVMSLVQAGQERAESRAQIFQHIWQAANSAVGTPSAELPQLVNGQGAWQKDIPHLSEPWYC